MSSSFILLPWPQSLSLGEGALDLADHRLIALVAPRPADLSFAARRIQAALARYAGVQWGLVGGDAVPQDQIGLRIVVGRGTGRAESYRLSVTADGLLIEAQDLAGAFYGVATLVQLVQQGRTRLPILQIEDWPDLPHRGVMLDISRDKVPTMETLYALVDRLAGWKINQLQLYTEHTFAYRQHPEVWAKASPMTADQILALDAYCRERHIELVPNQNSFGHMHRWFEHPRYLPLAETEDGFITPWGERQALPFSLTPANPQSLQFLAGLYDELLPNFTSQQFNVGCDETFDLGQGRSRQLCQERGEGRVYLDFLLEVHRLVTARGRVMQFWGDIIGSHPELVPELPRDAIALEWGYEADHDFRGKCARFAEAGIRFYVCPGTSSWLSIAGRTDNAIGNIHNAVENGLRYGASGVLTTDWGDLGHWQPLPVSYLGFACGAALGWSYRANTSLDLPGALDRLVFEDEAGVMGKLAYDLGNAYQQPGVLIPNGSVLFWAFHYPLDLFVNTPADGRFGWQMGLLQTAADLPAGLRKTIAYVDEVIGRLADARMTCADAELVAEEFQLVADLLRHGARRMLLVLGQADVSRDALRAELVTLEARYRAQWLARNRPGGLEDSVKRMQEARA